MLGVGRNGKMSVKGYKLPVIRQISFGDLMYGMGTIISNTVLFSCTLLKE